MKPKFEASPRTVVGPIANQLHALELDIKTKHPKNLAEQKKAWDALLAEHKYTEEKRIRLEKERSTDPNLNSETEAGRLAIAKAIDVEFNRRPRGPGSYEGELALVIDEIGKKIKQQNTLQDKVDELVEAKNDAEHARENLLAEIEEGKENTRLQEKLSQTDAVISRTSSALNEAIFALNAFNKEI